MHASTEHIVALSARCAGTKNCAGPHPRSIRPRLFCASPKVPTREHTMAYVDHSYGGDRTCSAGHDAWDPDCMMCVSGHVFSASYHQKRLRTPDDWAHCCDPAKHRKRTYGCIECTMPRYITKDEAQKRRHTRRRRRRRRRERT